MRILSFTAASLLLSALALSGCQSDGAPVASDLNSSNPEVAAQARKVQELLTEVDRQKAVIEADKAKLTAIEQQLEGSRQNLDGLKKQVQATP